MPQRSVLDDLGEEITGIVAPVSMCMALVVLLVKALNPDGSADAASVAMATVAYHEQDSDSAGQKLGGALLNAVVFVAIVAAMTFVLFLLFKWGCYKLIYGYLSFGMLSIFFFFTGALCVQLLRLAGVHLDLVSLCLLLFNFSVVGVLAMFFLPLPLFLKQCYTVWVGVCTAYVFSHVPEWTTWVLLVAMALYDLAAVLLPGGPLKILVELAIEREQELPALVYEARPTTGAYQRGMWRRQQQQQQQSQQQQQGLLAAVGAWADGSDGGGGGDSVLGGSEGGAEGGSPSQRTALLRGIQQRSSDELQGVQQQQQRQQQQEMVTTPRALMVGRRPAADVPSAAAAAPAAAAVGAGSSSSMHPPPAASAAAGAGAGGGSAGLAAAAGESERLLQGQGPAAADRQGYGQAGGLRQGPPTPPSPSSPLHDDDGSLSDGIKLGLGDFIFYSMLVGRAAMYDVMTVFASYIAVIAGLVTTLLLLALARKALPALPVSIALGIVFYFLTRLVMEPVVVPLALHMAFF